MCYPSMHFRWYPSMPCSRSPGRKGSPGPHPRKKWRGSGPGPQPRGKLRGIWSRGPALWGGTWSWGVPGPGGCLLWGCLVGTPQDNYCCEWYASYWNAFLLKRLFPYPDIKNLNKPRLHSGIKCVNNLPPYPFDIRYICTFLLDIDVSCIHTLTVVFNVSHPHTLM